MSETVLFLHIPKTGGKTLANCVYNSVHTVSMEGRSLDPRLSPYMKDGVWWHPGGFFKLPDMEPPQSVQSFLSSPDIKAIVGHFSFGLHQYGAGPARYVTMLRDPVERVISLYYHLVARNIWRREISLEEFVGDCPADGWISDLKLGDWFAFPPDFSESAIRSASRTIVDNDQTRRISGLEPPFGECNLDTLQRAVDNLTQWFDVVGLVEHFDESLMLMIRHFNWNANIVYFKRNFNRSKPSVETIPARTRQLILERNMLDWRLYQAANEIFQATLSRQESDFETRLLAFRERNMRHQSQHERTAQEYDIG